MNRSEIHLLIGFILGASLAMLGTVFAMYPRREPSYLVAETVAIASGVSRLPGESNGDLHKRAIRHALRLDQ